MIWLSFTVLCKRETEELVDEDIRFSLEVSDGLPVEIDPIQFRRILDNLVDNARKYLAVKPLIISITGQMQEQEVVWTFTDNGKGVAKDRLDLIFEEFYREDDTRQQVEGHGLGLAIVKILWRDWMVRYLLRQLQVFDLSLDYLERIRNDTDFNRRR